MNIVLIRLIQKHGGLFYKLLFLLSTNNHLTSCNINMHHLSCHFKDDGKLVKLSTNMADKTSLPIKPCSDTLFMS